MTNQSTSLKYQPPRVALLAHMMTPGVVQIPGDVSVAEAASLLEREHMPCLLVKDTDAIFGLMTPTDIVKKVVAQGLHPDEIEVRTIMSRPVQFIEYDRAADEASTLMLSSGSPILIVTKQDQPVGVLTAHDLALSPARCHIRVPVTITVPDKTAAGAQHQAIIVQLSHVGAMVQSPTQLLPGAKIVLNFSLPELPDPLTVNGTILDDSDRAAGPGKRPASANPSVEIQFADLSPTDRSRIKAWVRQNSAAATGLS